MGLIYGAYQREPDGALHYVATGQRLVPGAISADRLLFQYRDKEVDQTILILPTDSPSRDPASEPGIHAVVDWNLPQHDWVKKDYGLWRRVTWFLLDALLVWLLEEGRPQRSVRVYGGWFNGSWLKRGRFFGSGSKPNADADTLAEEPGRPGSYRLLLQRDARDPPGHPDRVAAWPCPISAAAAGAGPRISQVLLATRPMATASRLARAAVFASAEAKALMFERPHESLPRMRSVQHDRGVGDSSGRG